MLQGNKIVIAGGSGFVGSAMADNWAKDNIVVILSRRQPNKVDNSYGKKAVKRGFIFQMSRERLVQPRSRK